MTEKEGSDLDVLVEFEEGANLLHFVGLAEFLEETPRGKPRGIFSAAQSSCAGPCSISR